MIKTTLADVLTNSRERNNDDEIIGRGKSLIQNFGKRLSESADGMVFVIVN